jgi:uncharacterized protein (TIGR02996 family)
MVIDRQTHLGLIRALVSDPDDDTSRAVYADWLEEQGDPLGELVRVEAEMTRDWPTLEMSYNPVRDRGALALARWSRARGQRSLSLDQAKVTGAGVAKLAASGHLRGLWEIVLGGNPIGDEGLAALARCPDLIELRELEIYAVDMTDEGAYLLAESPYLPQKLEVCVFDHPDLSEEALKALGERFVKVLGD